VSSIVHVAVPVSLVLHNPFTPLVIPYPPLSTSILFLLPDLVSPFLIQSPWLGSRPYYRVFKPGNPSPLLFFGCCPQTVEGSFDFSLGPLFPRKAVTLVMRTDYLSFFTPPFFLFVFFLFYSHSISLSPHRYLWNLPSFSVNVTFPYFCVTPAGLYPSSFPPRLRLVFFYFLHLQPLLNFSSSLICSLSHAFLFFVFTFLSALGVQQDRLRQFPNHPGFFEYSFPQLSWVFSPQPQGLKECPFLSSSPIADNPRVALWGPKIEMILLSKLQEPPDFFRILAPQTRLFGFPWNTVLLPASSRRFALCVAVQCLHPSSFFTFFGQPLLFLSSGLHSDFC